VHTSASRSLLGLARNFKQLSVADPLTQCLAPRLTRTFASQTQLPLSDIAQEMAAEVNNFSISEPSRPSNYPRSNITTSATPSELYTLSHPILATLHSWPSIEPSGHKFFHPEHLDAPLRRDILHRAVIYEADKSRQGTASTKWRFDVHGSNRKLHAQKGTGRARVRDRKSPIRRGGGVAFGPKPRDFSTELQQKVYLQAFRTALSYRFRKNELIILDSKSKLHLPEDNGARFLDNLFRANRWGTGHGRSLLVTKLGVDEQPGRIFEEMESVGEHGEIKTHEDVDVKDLLMFGRVVIEERALRSLFRFLAKDR